MNMEFKYTELLYIWHLIWHMLWIAVILSNFLTDLLYVREGISFAKDLLELSSPYFGILLRLHGPVHLSAL